MSDCTEINRRRAAACSLPTRPSWYPDQFRYGSGLSVPRVESGPTPPLRAYDGLDHDTSSRFALDK